MPPLLTWSRRLLHLLKTIPKLQGGHIWYRKNDLKEMDRDVYRSNHIGVIFQAYNLLTNACAVENMLMSMYISNSGTFNAKENMERAFALLEKVGIDRDKATRKVLKLSGGEQQRVGIARAMAHNGLYKPKHWYRLAPFRYRRYIFLVLLRV